MSGFEKYPGGEQGSQNTILGWIPDPDIHTGFAIDETILGKEKTFFSLPIEKEQSSCSRMGPACQQPNLRESMRQRIGAGHQTPDWIRGAGFRVG